MKLLLINPNTTVSMTKKMALAARSVANSRTEVIAQTAAYGPESIEGYYDEVFSVPPLLEKIRGADPDIGGVVIGCFDDTGVDAARSITSVPVIGICQAAIQAASIVAGSFSIVTTLERSVPALEDLVRRYGYAHACRGVRASDIPVLELEDPASNALERLREELARAVREDRAEAIVLGCAGMVDLAHRLSEEFGRPVVEGVTAAVKIIEGLHALGLRTSKAGGYASPRAKIYSGTFARYAPAQSAHKA
ncbi:MAG: allantoin racemase [Gammaproteobacteria bacterium]|jgi:allantoin racemase